MVRGNASIMQRKDSKDEDETFKRKERERGNEQQETTGQSDVIRRNNEKREKQEGWSFKWRDGSLDALQHLLTLLIAVYNTTQTPFSVLPQCLSYVTACI